MRARPSSWFKSEQAVGFRRRKGPKHRSQRRLDVESLEARLLMTRDTTIPSDAEFHIADSTAAQVFRVDTVNDPIDGLKAVLHMADNAPANLQTLYEFNVTLDADGDTWATYPVQIVLPGAQMVSDLASEHATEAEATLADDSSNITAMTLNPDGRFTITGMANGFSSQSIAHDEAGQVTDIGTNLDLIARMLPAAKSNSMNAGLVQNRLNVYAAIDQIGDDITNAGLDSNDPTAQAYSHQMGAALYELFDQLTADMASDNETLSAAATSTYNTLLSQSDLYFRMWSGKGINSQVYQYDNKNLNDQEYSVLYETGQVDLLNQFTVALDRPAVATVSIPDDYMSMMMLGPMNFLTTETGSDTAAAATYVDATNHSTAYGSSPTFTVSDASGDEKDGFVRFNLSSLLTGKSDKLNFDNATLSLHLASAPTTAPQINVQAEPNTTWIDSGTGALTADGVDTTLNGASTPITQAKWQLPSRTVTVDVSDALRRAARVGDLNYDGSLDTGTDDIYAFEDRVLNESSYDATYADDLRVDEYPDYRADTNFDGSVNRSDLGPLLAMHGYKQGDVNFDHVVNGLDIAVYSTHWGSTTARYEDGDANFDGVVAGLDAAYVASHWLQTSSGAAVTPALTLRLSTTDNASATFVSNDGSANAPTLSFNQTPDVIIKGFHTEPLDNNLHVDYLVTHGAVTAFDIGVFRSADGSDTNQAYMTGIHIDGSSDLAAGFHSVSIAPGSKFNDDPDPADIADNDVEEDYYLRAVVDYDNLLREPDEINNAMPFAGGVFLSANGTVQVQGTSANDTVTVNTTGVTFNGVTKSVDVNNSHAVHVRVHGGSNSVSASSSVTVPLWEVGGPGNDSLTGGGGDDILAGGGGTDTFTASGGTDTKTAGALSARNHAPYFESVGNPYTEVRPHDGSGGTLVLKSHVGSGGLVETVAFQAVAVDPDGQAVHYSLSTGAPSGASIDEDTGEFTWSPSAPTAGTTQTNTFSVLATDDDGNTATQPVTIQVINHTDNTPPTISALSLGGPVIAQQWLSHFYPTYDFVGTITLSDDSASGTYLQSHYTVISQPSGSTVTPSTTAGVLDFHWTVSAADTPIDAPLVLSVTDNDGAVTTKEVTVFAVTTADIGDDSQTFKPVVASADRDSPLSITENETTPILLADPFYNPLITDPYDIVGSWLSVYFADIPPTTTVTGIFDQQPDGAYFDPDTPYLLYYTPPADFVGTATIKYHYNISTTDFTVSIGPPGVAGIGGTYNAQTPATIVINVGHPSYLVTGTTLYDAGDQHNGGGCTCATGDAPDVNTDSGAAKDTEELTDGVDINYDPSRGPPIIGVNVTAGGNDPGGFTANLIVNGEEHGSISVPDGLTYAGDQAQVFIPFNPGDLPSGQYNYKIELVPSDPHSYGLSTIEYVAPHPLTLRRHDQWGLGDGWALKGIDRLLFGYDPATTTKLIDGTQWIDWVDGDGNDHQFAVDDLSSTEGAVATDDANGTRLKFGTGTYLSTGYTPYLVMSDKTGHTEAFDTLGRLIYAADADHAVNDHIVYEADSGDDVYKVHYIYNPLLYHATTFAYNDDGKLETVTNNYTGQTTHLYYALGNGLLNDIRYLDPLAERSALDTLFDYDSQNRLDNIAWPGDVWRSYKYDYLGNDVTITYSDDTLDNPDDNPYATLLRTYAPPRQLDFHYGEIPLWITHSDTLGIDRDPLTYSQPRREGRYVDTQGNVKLLSTDDDGNITTEINPNGSVTTHTYNESHQVLTMTTPDPDGAGVLDTSTTIHHYDDYGNEYQADYADSSHEYWSYDNPSFPGIATSHTDQIGRLTKYDLDTGGNVIRMRQIVGTEDTIGSPVDDLVTLYTYYDGSDGTPKGLLETETDPRGIETDYTYFHNTSHPESFGKIETVTTYSITGHSVTSAVSYTYDARGNLTTETDPLGRVTTHEYDGFNRLIEDTLPDPDGASTVYVSPTVDYVYNDDGQLYQTTDFNGTTTYKYDGQGRLQYTIQPDPLYGDADDNVESTTNPVSKSEYDAAGNLTATIDPLKRRTDYTYDSSNRLIKTTLPGPDPDHPNDNRPVLLRTYDFAGNLRSETDANGNTTTYFYDVMNRVTDQIGPDPDGFGPAPAPETTYTYDAAGNQTTVSVATGDVSHPWAVTTYRYDVLGRVSMMIAPNPDNGTAPVHDYDPPASGTPYVSYTYDKDNNVLTETTGQGNGSGVDVWGITTYVYDDLNRQTDIFAPRPSTGLYDSTYSPNTHYTYDAAGQLLQVKDPNGNYTTYQYDDLGRLKRQIMPKPSDGSGPSGGVTGDPATGTPFTSYTYDGAGNVLTQTTGTGSSTNWATTTYAYDHLNHRITTYAPDSLYGTHTGGSLTTHITYDFNGETLATTDPAGNVSTNRYDNLGRLVMTIAPNPADGSAPTTSTSPPASDTPYTTYEYDANGNVVKQMDALGETTLYSYDGKNRQTSVTDANGAITSYAYDSQGNRTSITDPDGNVTSWTYDFLNRVTTETDAREKVRHYSYEDGGGNLTKVVDRNDKKITYTYDHLNRQTDENWYVSHTSSTVTETIHHAYDPGNRVIAITDKDGSGTSINEDLAYSYDGDGRLLDTDEQLVGLAQTAHVAQAYEDASGLRTSQTTSFWSTIDYVNNYTYDRMNRVATIGQNGVGGGDATDYKYVSFFYDADGRLQQINDYNNVYYASDPLVVSDYSYDDASRLTGIDQHNYTNTVTFGQYSWIQNSANEVTSFADTAHSSEDASYQYDATGQLTTVTATHGELYSYDDNGNRISSTSGTASGSYTTDTNNWLTSDGTFNYGYDDEGNLTSRTRISSASVDDHTVLYGYDNCNRLITVTNKNTGGTVTQIIYYTYNAIDQRIGKAVDLGGNGSIDRREFYVYDGTNVVVDLVDSDGDGTAHNPELSRRYLYGPAVDQLLAEEDLSADRWSTQRILFHLLDNQETTRGLVYNNGTLDEHYTYDSYGNLLEVTDAVGDPVGSPHTRFLYTSRELDLDTGLQYNRNRWYDPAIGRWISQDPIGFKAHDPNLYRYVKNAPTDRIDPSGTKDPTDTDENHPGEFSIKIGPSKLSKAKCSSNVSVRYLPSDQDKALYSQIAMKIYVTTFQVDYGVFGNRILQKPWHLDIPKDPKDLETWPAPNPFGAEWNDNPGFKVDLNYDLLSGLANRCPPAGAHKSLDQQWEAVAYGKRIDNDQWEVIGAANWGHHCDFSYCRSTIGPLDGKTGLPTGGSCVVKVNVQRYPQPNANSLEAAYQKPTKPIYGSSDY